MATTKVRPPLLDPRWIRIDAVEDHQRWKKLPPEQKRAYCRMMRDARISWVAHWRGKSLEYVTERICSAQAAVADWRRNGWDSAWECRGALMYRSLAAEATERGLERTARLRELAREVGKGGTVLLYGAGAGAAIYPWAEQEAKVTVVTRAASWSTQALYHRARQDYVTLDIRETDHHWFERGLRNKYDAVVCLDLLDRVHDAVAIVVYQSMRAGVLVLMYKFNPTVETPWVRMAIAGHTQSPVAVMAQTLTQAGRTLDVSCQWSDDLLLLR